MTDRDDMIEGYLDDKLSEEARGEFEELMHANSSLEREVRAEQMIRESLRSKPALPVQTHAEPSSVILAKLNATSRMSMSGITSAGGLLRTILRTPIGAGLVSVAGMAALVLGGLALESMFRESTLSDHNGSRGIQNPSLPSPPEVVEENNRESGTTDIGLADKILRGTFAHKSSRTTSNGDKGAAAVVSTISAAEENRAYALQFDGDDFVEVGNPPDLHLSDALTLEAWVNPRAEYYNAVICKGDAWYGIDLAKGLRPGFFFPTLAIDFDGTEEYWVRTLMADTVPEADRTHLGCTEEYWGRALLPDTVPQGEWTHLACTYDAQVELINIYVNGEQRASLHATGKIRGDSGSFRIGAREPSIPDYQEFFHGELDEIRVWNKARTEREIRADMNRRLTGDENGLVAYYTFDHKPGQQAEDAVGENHGRLGAGSEEDQHDPTWIESELPY